MEARYPKLKIKQILNHAGGVFIGDRERMGLGIEYPLSKVKFCSKFFIKKKE